jgi:formamidopyrimidine-DNA glycosylase
MPELPEVELASRALGRAVIGRKIVAAELLRPKLVADTTPENFAARLRGATFLETGRRGKHILVFFDNRLALIVHLRMTGRFLLLSPDADAPQHTHVIFYLDNELRLVFVDPRRFGFMRLTTRDEHLNAKELARLAPEPLSDAFSDNYLFGCLRRTKRGVKEVLLDQTRVAGVGNIYAAEALFLAGIHPAAVCAELSRARVKRLRRAIAEVLRESIAHGSTMNVQDLEAVESSYYGGPYEDHWRVYDREGQPCPRCGKLIRRITQGGRSSYFCGRCQRR